MSIPCYGPTNPERTNGRGESPRRHTSILELNVEKEAYYRKLHSAAWPSVLQLIAEANIRNYSISIALIQGKKYLVSYFEYAGDDFEGDMKKISENRETQRWWEECKPCQYPIPGRKEGEWWMELEQVFYFNPSK